MNEQWYVCTDEIKKKKLLVFIFDDKKCVQRDTDLEQRNEIDVAILCVNLYRANAELV